MKQSSNQTQEQHKKSTKKSPLVEVTKIFNAPITEVFKAFKDEELIRHWWGPENFTCAHAELDFEEEGSYLFSMKSKSDEHKTLWSTGTYNQIVSNQLIVMSDQPSDENGRVITAEEAGFEGPYADDGPAYITFEFSRVSAGTQVKLSHENLPARLHDDCVEGWSSTLEKIRPLVEKH